MTNYYEELGLDRRKRIDEINADLSKLESTWKRREVTNPEKATTMLALIIQARKVFASDAARRTYDNDLDNSLKQPEQIDPNKERGESLKKWRDQASSYYASGQYDLAKVAVEKAISLSNVNGDDDSLFALAADIYKDNGDLQTAMSYINRAIVAAPEVSAYYLSKGLIYDQQASVAMQQRGYGNPASFRAEARKMFQMADIKAEQSGDLANRARACGALAFSYYFQDPVDKQEGEDFANLAVKFGGDSWGNADKVLKEINAIREEERRKELEKENARKEGIYQEAKRVAQSSKISELERAISKFETITDYKDSKQQIETLVEKIQKIVDRAEKKKQQKSNIHKITIKVILIAIPVIVVAVLIGLIIHNVQHSKCGKNLKWEYDSDSRTLTIEGTGPMYDDFEPYYKDYGRKRPWDVELLYNEIETIIIEDGCTRIGEDAFSSFRNLKKVQIPDSVTSIGDSSFRLCGKLERLDLPSNLVSIDGDPFLESGIKSLYIPRNVESLDAVGDNTTLEEINVDSNNIFFTSLEGVLFNKDMTVLWAYPKAKKDDHYSIPNGVNEIRSDAFSYASSLQSVFIPESVNTIGRGAFSHCTNLMDINIPLSITILPEDIFFGCGFITVNIPPQIVVIGDGAYSESHNLKSVYIPEGVEKIGNYAFYFCDNLNDISIPQSVKTIGYSALFFGSKEDSIIHYSGTVDQWLSFASSSIDIDFTGTVECTDGNYRY